MNTDSIDCRKVEEIEKVGDFGFDELKKCLYVWLPGTTGPTAIPIRTQGPFPERVWQWDGNEEKPTLTPSILFNGSWHGWLRNGRLCSC